MMFLKYEPSDSASDPLLKCDDCKKIVAKHYIMKNGGCNHCGNRRFKSIQKIEESDIELLKTGQYNLGISEYQVDPEFIALFGLELTNIDTNIGGNEGVEDDV